MTKQTNAVNFTGLERFVVDPNPSFGAYTTIQEAVDAASAAGGGVVYLSDATYNETVSMKHMVSVCALGNVGLSQSVVINGGLDFDTTGGNITCEVTGILIQGAGGNPGVFMHGPSQCVVTFVDCYFSADTSTAIDCQVGGTQRIFNSFFAANSGQKLWNVTDSTWLIWSSAPSGNDTYSTINGANAALFFVGCLANDAFDITEGQVIYNGSLVSTISTLPLALVRLNGVFGLPNSIVTESNSASGFIVDANGPGDGGINFVLSMGGAPGVTVAFDPDLQNTYLTEYPLASAGTTGTATRGSAAFDSTTFSVSSTGFVTTTGSSAAWQDTTASQSIVNGEGYSVSSGAVVLTLPTTAAFGTSFKVSLQGGTSWQIAQNAGQSIRFGNQSTTVGAGGSITSMAQGDTLSLVCDVANLHWFVENNVGNVTIV